MGVVADAERDRAWDGMGVKIETDTQTHTETQSQRKGRSSFSMYFLSQREEAIRGGQPWTEN